MENIIDLAAERTLRQNLAQQAAEGAEALVGELQHAGQIHADLAWVLAAPVRHRDNAMKDGIYELALARLNKIVSGAMGDMNGTEQVRLHATEQAKTIAFAAFNARLLTLAAAEQDSTPPA